MSVQPYPGKGLSLSQLIFALNEELKHVTYSPLFALEAVSQLDRDASTMLATIREWKNSFAYVNRVPTDILSLIPTHLPTQKDRFHAASVCRHWRGVLLGHGALWSQLFLEKGEECVSALLERAKGSALNIITHRDVPVGIMTLISPRAQQIASLEFMGNYWQDMIAFSELYSDQLPLPHTLKVVSLKTVDSHYQPVVVTAPSLPLFRGSINLQKFVIHPWKLSSLSHFIFPNLTTFELSETSVPEMCSASCLLNFLKASPMLQTVKMKISTEIMLENVPQEIVVVLPHVETFSLHVLVTHRAVPRIYDIAAYVSCPCAKYTSLTQGMYDDEMSADLEVFPTPDLWNAIVHQYTESPIEKVTLKIKSSTNVHIDCFLTFWSSGACVIILGFKIYETYSEEDELNKLPEEMGWEIFSKALTTIRDHPLLSHTKRLHIEQRAGMSNIDEMGVENEVWELFSSLGPLDELTICGCDLHVPLARLINNRVLYHPEQHNVSLQIKKLKILDPSTRADEMVCVEGIVALAKLQHALGTPFQCVTVRTWYYHDGMEEELRRWVPTVDWSH